ncbi:hypothetical protein DQ400_19195 [Vreelandella sulfidaeris]|jgi:hypothetical protein|uniref:Uncharacterized protein n=5 Tax=Vreelandella TaxID=3137766 RepID=A0A365TI32_9GAMM|nr:MULTISPECIES: hypothetical protein [Halomonas]AJY52914.1 hypothetical protein KO116_P100157 [Halomonas sp. KO116]NVF16322.1 hypothetical protein [Halomonas maris]NYS80047.1 hypothetical protein [Halomonas glaciei]RBI65153.1 hypothetical protein DQ400_19195 [Halomonas sulfidaeris]|tara:strand:+ start:12811 stop:13374 length:564 start_codon:yes stop_codon:yes gene_type:complete
MFIPSQNRPRQILILSTVTLGTAFLAGCGDPAPGEGVENPMMQGPSPEVVGAQEAVNSPDIPAIDPQTMQEAEIEKVLGDAAYCAYRYTAESPPILAIDNTDQGQGARAVTKIHGRLVELSADHNPDYENLKQGLMLTAEGLTMRVFSDEEEPESAEPGELITAELHFSLQQGLNAGYLGWYRCETE